MPDRKEMKDDGGNGDFSPMRLDAATRAIQKYMEKLPPEAMDGAAEMLQGPRTPGGSPYIPDSPEEGIPSMGESPTEVTAGAAEMLQQRGPKSEHRRFAESKETSYDKMATRPGDPFEYAMKGDRIFVRKKGEEEFRDVTGIANDSQIRAVINEHGKAQEKKDERPHTFKRSGGEPMSVQERTGVEDRPPVTTEDFEKAPEDVRLLRQLVRGSR